MKIFVKFAIAAAVDLCVVQPTATPRPQGQEYADNAAPMAQATPAPARRSAERRERASASRLDRAVQQRQPRRAARMRDRAERGSDQDRPADRADQHPRASDTRAPVALVQLPLGLNLPAGAKLQVDDGKTSDLQIQTCEARGCYANLPISPDLLAAMKSGKQLKISFQNLAKETITIPMPLADFAAAYEKIK